MKHRHEIFLGRIDPREISVVASLLRPTAWDQKVVEDDLIEYVSHSRLIKATPVVEVINGTLTLVSGLPFVSAARLASPPLEKIVCKIEADEKTIKRLGVELVTPTELLHEYPVDERYRSIEMLAFMQDVSEEKKRVMVRNFDEFIQQVSATPELYGGNYRSLSKFEWSPDNMKVVWSWEKTDQDGTHLLNFITLLEKINDRVAPIRSWNGISWPLR
ncbi:MAG TPA: hypothetical protein VGW12_00290 [Pyrinomonadaceae bacterium]|nr:hypothetical protein [Pyrinomonadaceae bacterium]